MEDPGKYRKQSSETGSVQFEDDGRRRSKSSSTLTGSQSPVKLFHLPTFTELLESTQESGRGAPATRKKMTAASPTSPTNQSAPKSAIRACQFCRVRKIKCDTLKPRCGSCIINKRECIYVNEPPKKRPSKAIINGISKEKRVLEEFVIRLKGASSKERDFYLDSVTVKDGQVTLPSLLDVASDGGDGFKGPPLERVMSNGTDAMVLDAEIHLDGSSSDEEGDAFIPFADRVDGSTGLHHHRTSIAEQSPRIPPAPEQCRSQLIAQAALQLQREHGLRHLEYIRGVPGELAMHLLDLHWNRQHHTFHLTYRPAFMRELVTGGPYCTDFLLNAVFACSSKFSHRPELRDDPGDPESAGRRFFRRCDELLAEQSLLSFSSIPTIIGLVLLGATFNARGLSSKGWLYTGYALRMVYDLGLHLDRKVTLENAEEIEIRRRVFWGAFISEKLQSLYLGRPVTIQLRDAHVSRDFMDMIEEMELWSPYIDPKSTDTMWNLPAPTPIYSISTFQNLCTLSKIMTKIINQVYVSGGPAESTGSRLEILDNELSSWYSSLPSHLVFEPWSREPSSSPHVAAPNVIILLTTYNALVILLHRPFISNSLLRRTTSPATSWKKCTTAARNITSLVLAYQSVYPLRRASYLLSYAVYVSLTIHVRNTAAAENNSESAGGNAASLLASSLKCLDELSVPNGGVADLARIIRKLVEEHGIRALPDPAIDAETPTSQDLEAIYPMFPDQFVGFGTIGDPYSMGFDTQSTDLLFGFMNDSFLSPPAFATDFSMA